MPWTIERYDDRKDAWLYIGHFFIYRSNALMALDDLNHFDLGPKISQAKIEHDRYSRYLEEQMKLYYAGLRNDKPPEPTAFNPGSIKLYRVREIIFEDDDNE